MTTLALAVSVVFQLKHHTSVSSGSDAVVVSANCVERKARHIVGEMPAGAEMRHHGDALGQNRQAAASSLVMWLGVVKS